MDRCTGGVMLGAEISQDRAHAAIVAAGHLEHGLVLIELVVYMAGTAGAVDRVMELHGRWRSWAWWSIRWAARRPCGGRCGSAPASTWSSRLPLT
jgi:hypothetical protein